MQNNNQLLEKLLAFDVTDKTDDYSFIQRLASENQWSLTYAENCFVEYKKFLYLCAISPSPMTPSDAVDQVWHLHLTYTESYWNHLCKNILPNPIHHKPTKGGEDEKNKFWNQYSDTLNLYQKMFKKDPPKAIWPSVAERFNPKLSFARVNQSDFFLIKKPSKAIAITLLAPFFLAACVQLEGENSFWLIVKWVVGVYIAYRVLRWLFSGTGGRGGSGGGGGCGSGCGGGGCGGS